MVRKQLAFIFLDDLQQKETAISEEATGQEDANQPTEEEVTAE